MYVIRHAAGKERLTILSNTAKRRCQSGQPDHIKKKERGFRSKNDFKEGEKHQISNINYLRWAGSSETLRNGLEFEIWFKI